MTEARLRDGRYEITGTLGEGAQGTTFDAIDKSTGAAVAIKRFSIRGARSWKDVELAEREAKVLESLSHPLLPAHIEHFEENGALYLVMQKIDGKSLLSITAGGGSLSRMEVMRFLEDASSVLEYLHGRSPPVIHRDVNAKNVIRRADGSHVLVDFGAVRDKLKPEGGSTVVGTFGYMAPEQFQGRAVPASDVFSVGATALRLLTGLEPDKLPHRGLAIDVGAALGGGFDPVLRSVLEKMTDPDPDRRATSIAPLLERLRRASPAHNRKEPAEQRARGKDASNARQQQNAYDYRDSYDYKDRWLREEARRAQREAERAERVARQSARQDEHRARQSAHRARRDAHRAWRRGRRLHGPPFAIAVVGINAAIVVVTFVMGVFVPLLLTLLSVLFGPSLRRAALDVRRSGDEAQASMRHFLQYLLYGAAGPPQDKGGVRVDTSPEPPASARPKVRVTDEIEVIDTTGTEIPDEPRRRV